MTTPAPTRLPTAVLERLRRLSDTRLLVRDSPEIDDYRTDALSSERGTPLAVLRPGSEEELSAVIGVLSDAGIPFVPRGAGSGLAGGAVPREAAVVTTERMTAIHDLDAREATATVEPGVITDRISRAAAPHGLRYAPDPASGGFCTIGGNVAVDAGGAHCLKHGVTTDHVLGLRVVLPGGEVVGLGRGADGSLDLAGLFTGSEGTLGIVSRITVRLTPRAAAARTAFALFDGLGAAGEAVSEVLAAGVVPVALELIDRTTLRALRTRHPGALPSPAAEGAAALVVECEGFPREAEGEMEMVAEALRGAGARELHVASDAADRERLWTARREAYHALRTTAPDLLIQDVTVPRTELPSTLTHIERIGERLDLRIANFFHAGDGNLHPNFLFDRSDPDQVRAVRAATREIAILCVEAGGTITGEHGVGRDKRHLMELLFGAAEMNVLRNLKRAFDPDDLANPDKIFPDAPATPAPDDERRPAGDRIDLRARDLTVSVDADVPVAELGEALRAEALWLPIASSPAIGTVGELVMRAPAGPFDAAYGPVRRHLLACRMLAPDGRELRWGRAVMKNVAGYDVPRLICGSGGALGHVTRATFRLWPAPAEGRLHELDALGGATPELARRAAAPDAAAAFRPDAVVWRIRSDEGEDGSRVLLYLVGTGSSVEARTARLVDWARAEGIDVRSRRYGPASKESMAREPAEEARRIGVVTLTTTLRSFPETSRRARAALGADLVDMEGYPATGTVRCFYRRRAAPPADEATGTGARTAADGAPSDDISPPLERLLSVGGPLAFRVERGSEAEIEAVRERRPESLRRLESRVIGALGGRVSVDL